MIKRSFSCILGLMLAGFVAIGPVQALFVDTSLLLDPGPISNGEAYINSPSSLVAASIDDTYKFTADGKVFLEATAFTILPTGAGLRGIKFLKYEWFSDALLSVSLSGAPIQYTDEFGVLDALQIATSIVLLDTFSAFLHVTGDYLQNGGTYELKVAAVPLPAAGILFGSALAGIGFLSRRRRKKLNTHAVI